MAIVVALSATLITAQGGGRGFFGSFRDVRNTPSGTSTNVISNTAAPVTTPAATTPAVVVPGLNDGTVIVPEKAWEICTNCNDDPANPTPAPAVDEKKRFPIMPTVPNKPIYNQAITLVENKKPDGTTCFACPQRQGIEHLCWVENNAVYRNTLGDDYHAQMTVISSPAC